MMPLLSRNVDKVLPYYTDIGVYRSPGRTNGSKLALRPWRWRRYSSVTPMTFYRTTRVNIPDDVTLHRHRCDSLYSNQYVFSLSEPYSKMSSCTFPLLQKRPMTTAGSCLEGQSWRHPMSRYCNEMSDPTARVHSDGNGYFWQLTTSWFNMTHKNVSIPQKTFLGKL
jgi:hypothetical protein